SVRDGGRVGAPAADISEIHVQVFKLDGPVAIDRSLGSCAHCPTCARRPPAERHQGSIRREMTVSETSGRIKQHAICRKEANPTARSAKPVKLVICRQN